MTPVAEFQELGAGLYFWEGYEPAVKSNLCAAAVACGEELLLIDPVPLAPEPLRNLLAARRVHGIVLSNANHLRATSALRSADQPPLFAHETIAATLNLPITPLHSGSRIADAADVIAIDGAAPGEIALHLARDGGTVIVGDALIHFEPYGFTFLPPKYCDDAPAMQRSLRQLLDLPFERMLFAHGTPILHDAKARLARLLDHAG